VKSPQESKSKDDIYKLLATVPGDEAYRPLNGALSLLVPPAFRKEGPVLFSAKSPDAYVSLGLLSITWRMSLASNSFAW
jgi:hypothetical protein